MLYDAYVVKMEKLVKVRNFIIKFKYLICAVLALILAATFTFLLSIGNITVTQKPEETIMYGQHIEIGGKAFMEDVFFEYAEEHSNKWSTVEPTEVGDYKVRVGANKVFGKNKYSEEFYYSITPKDIEVSISSTVVEYGSLPELSANLVSGDRIDSFVINYNDELSLNPKIKIDPSTIVIKNKAGKNVSSSYNITTESLEGSLTIIKRGLSILTASAEKDYDGTALSANDYEITSGSLAEGDIIKIDYDGLQLDVGTSYNNAKVTIENSKGQDVTHFYQLTVNEGTLTVNKRDLIISTESGTKDYDGTALINTNYSLDDGSELLNSHRIVVDSINIPSITNVGKISNTLSIKVYNSSGVDVTDVYNITPGTIGTLEVTKRKITLETGSATQIYNGYELTCDQVSTTSGNSLVSGHYFVVKESNRSSLTDVGSIQNKLEVSIKDNNGIDVTSNYDIAEYKYGTLTVTKRSVSVRTASTTKEYDGIELSNFNFEILSGLGLADTDQFVVMRGTGLTNVGRVENILEFSIINNYGKDVTDNYDITNDYGYLEITSRFITVYAASLSKEYDGTPLKLSETDYQIFSGSLCYVNGISHTFKVLSSTNEITYVGSTTTEITSFDILDETGSSVSKNYTVILEAGILTIIPRNVTITTGSAEKVYDGTALQSQEYTVTSTNDIVEGDEFKVLNSSSITDVGTISNEFNYAVYKNGVDITYNYNIKLYYGTLKVTHRNITITTSSDEKVYDGTPLQNSGYTITGDGLAEGQKLFNLVIFGTITNVGQAYNEAHLEGIIDSNNRDVLDNYRVAIEYGILKVTPRAITILSGTDYKEVYDGEILTCSDTTITLGSLVLDHQVVVTEQSELLDVKQIENYIKAKITTASGENVSGNYEISYEYGTLEIKNKLTITIQTASDTKEYDGTPLSNANYQIISYNIFAENDTVNVTTAASVTYVHEGIVLNYLDLQIYNYKYYQDVTANYEITIYQGELSITPKAVTIAAKDLTKEYDGTPLKLSESDYTLENNTTLCSLDKCMILDSSSEITNVGTIETNITEYKIMSTYNEDITSSYEVTLLGGTLEITPRNITIQTSSAEKEYDGTPLFNLDYEIISNKSLVNNDYLEIISYSTITKIGKIDNELVFVVYNNFISDAYVSSIIDVTYNYNIEIIYGTLEIKPIHLEITTASDEKVYDGTPLENHTYTCVGNLIGNLEIIITGSITEVGKTPNTYSKINIVDEYGNILFDEDGLPFTNYYEFDVILGTLEVVSQDITILTSSKTQETYNGIELVSEDCELIVGNLVSTHSILVTKNTGLLAIDEVDNILVVEIVDAEGNIVTKNYKITYEYGKLAILNKLEIIIQTHSAEKVYDGTALKCLDYDVISANQIPETDSLNILKSTKVTYVQEEIVYNEFEVELYNDVYQKEVTDCYEITYINGQLTIIPKDIVISAGNLEKEYDGTPLILTNKEIKADENSDLCENDKVVVISSIGEITFVGSTSSRINEYKIVNKSNNDITSSYNVALEDGTLEVTPRNITIKTATAEKQYDGTPLYDTSFEITSKNKLVNDDYIIVNNYPSITDIGTITNELELIVYNDLYGDISENYNITYEYGELTVTKIKIKVTSSSSEKVYDGTPLTSQTCEIEGDIPTGHKFIIEYPNAIVDVGIIDNICTITKVYNIYESNDVTELYEIEYVYGTLEVTPIELTIKSSSKYQYMYSGEELKSPDFEIIEGMPLSGHEVKYIKSNGLLKVGQIENILEVDVFDSVGNSIGYNYEISYIYGTLEIENKLPITIQTSSAEQIYNGLALKSAGFTFITNNHSENDVFTVLKSTEVTYVQDETVYNEIELSIYNDVYEQDVTSCYEIEYIYGTLTITPKPITVKPYDLENEYNGNLQRVGKYDYETVDSELCYDDLFNILTSAGEITYVGSVETSILTYQILNNKNKDITSSYDVTLEKGTLTIVPRRITIQTASDEKEYDGTSLENFSYEITSTNKLAANDYIDILTGSSITEIGSIDNILIITIYNSDNIDISDNYDIEYILGTLEVKPISILITTQSDEKVYDGTPLTNSSYLIEGNKISSHNFDILVTGSITYVGTVDNTYIIYSIEDIYGNDVSSYYSIESDLGTLEITPRPITIKTGSKTQNTYNGEVIYNTSCSLVEGTLLKGHEMFVTNYTELLNVSAVDNVLEVEIIDRYGNIYTDNYDITYEYGTLEILNKIKITITTSSASKVYDGTPLVSHDYDVSSLKQVLLSDSIEVISSTELTYVLDEVTYNELDLKITNNTYGVDVTDCYDITFINGILEVTPKPITIKPQDVEKQYNGTYIKLDKYDYEVVGINDLYSADTFVILESIGELMFVGSVEAEITEYKIMCGLTDITSSYSVTLEKGLLTVTPREITVKTSDASKEYDKKSLYSTDVEIVSEQQLVNDDYFKVVSYSSITNIGTTQNILSLQVYNDIYNDVSSNYDITYIYGTLEVTKIILTISTASDEKVYDGEPLVNTTTPTITGNLLPNHKVIVTVTGTITDVGTTPNTFEFEGVYLYGYFNYSDYYEIREDLGTLEVTPRDITIQTSSSVKDTYDGEVLSSLGYDILEGNLVLDHRFSISEYSKLLNVGSTENKLVLDILDGKGNNVSHNYLIIYNYGKLEILNKLHITIETASDAKIYDGTPLKSTDYTITSLQQLLPSDSISVVKSTNLTYVEGPKDNEFTVRIMNDEYHESVTDSYEITYVNGTLEVFPREITVKPIDKVEQYNGKFIGLDSDDYEVVSINGLCSTDEFIILESTGQQLFVGSVDTIIDDYKIVNHINKDVTSCYTVNLETGILTIVPREITIQTSSASKQYDTKPLSSPEYKVITENALVNNDYLVVDTYSSITDLGVIDNEIEFIVMNKAFKDVSENYNITLQTGTLEITKITVKVITGSTSKIYDGTPLTFDDVTLEGNIIQNHVIEIHAVGEITNVGTTPNIYEIDRIYTRYTNLDVSRYYQFEDELGTLEVTPRGIILKTSSSTKYMYDGEYLTSLDLEVVSGSLPANHSWEVVEHTKLLDVKSVSNILKAIILNGELEDVTSNFDITYEYGTLEILNKLPITILTGSASKVYDGTPLRCYDFEVISSNQVPFNDVLFVDNSTSITYVDQTYTDNVLTVYAVSNLNGKDVTSNYEFSYEYGTLEITPRDIVVKAKDLQKQYDGTPLVLGESDYELIDGTSLGKNDQIVVLDSLKSIIYISMIDDNLITEWLIINKEFKDVSLNYNVELVEGSLEIVPREITIVTNSKTKEYDGFVLEDKGYTIYPEDALLEGDIITDNNYASITEIGKIQNSANIGIIYGNSMYSDYYDITVEFGELEVTKRKLTVYTDSAEKIYDGTPLTSNVYTYDGTVLPEHTLVIDVIGTITEVGETYNIYNLYIYDNNGIDVSDIYYEVTEKVGTLKVSAYEITIKTGSASKEYDGNALYSEEYNLVDSSLLEGDTIELTGITTVFEPGLYQNKHTYIIYNEYGEDVTSNYYINFEYGKLEITIEDLPEEEEPTGAGVNPSGNLSLGGGFTNNGQSNTVYFEFEATTSGSVYFKQMSYGDYVGTGFNSAPSFDYSSYEFNPIYLTSKILEENGYDLDTVKVRIVIDGLSYLLPYYGDGENDSSNSTDIFINIDHNNNYTTDFYLNNDLEDLLSLTTSDYKEFEQIYSEWVKDNYLAVPYSTKKVLNRLAIENNLYANSATIVEDVKNYIQNAAKYNLDFQFPQNVDDMVTYFLTESKEGICQHFAAAATMMYRTLGIPARYTVGFVAQAKENEVVVVKGDLAHAWVEVYIDGLGWVQVEVTGSGFAGEGPAGGGSGGGSGDNDQGNEDDKPLIIIRPEYLSKAYDGTPLYSNNLVEGADYDSAKLLEELLLKNYTYSAIISGEIIEIGQEPSVIQSFILYDENGNDVTSKYEIKYEENILEVTKDQIVLYVFDYQKYYDGKPCEIFQEDCYYIDGLNDRYTFQFEIFSTAVNCGVYTVEYMAVYTDDKGNDITDNYFIRVEGGEIVIDRLAIEITTGSSKEEYNEEEVLTNDAFWISKGKLIDGHTVEIENNSKLDNIGKVENKCNEAVIYDAKGNDVTNNYEISYVYGTLEYFE